MNINCKLKGESEQRDENESPIHKKHLALGQQ